MTQEEFFALSEEARAIAASIRPHLESVEGKPVLLWLDSYDLQTIVEVLEECSRVGAILAGLERAAMGAPVQ